MRKRSGEPRSKAQHHWHCLLVRVAVAKKISGGVCLYCQNKKSKVQIENSESFFVTLLLTISMSPYNIIYAVNKN